MKVLVLSITAGEGHNSTAKTICEYFNERGAEACVLDTYKYLNKALGLTVDKGYLFTVKSAKLAYKKAYRMLEKRRKSNDKISATRATNRVLASKLLPYIKEYQPDVIICTHIFAGMLLDSLKRHKKITARTYGIVTDFTMHPYWEEALHLDYIITANELLTIQAKKKGYTSEQILPSGIPINCKFEKIGDKAEARIELGLDIGKPTVLLMGGSMGYGNIESTVTMLDSLDRDFQLITVCGNNKEAKLRIDELQTKKKLLNLGYVNNVDRLMDASDCIITKPGGLTTSEALAKRLPIIIVNPIPGQEDRNTEFLLNYGAAMSVTKTHPLDEAIYELFEHPEKIELMRGAIDMIRKPESTRSLCDFVIERAREDGIEI
ncbi:MAG: glycosyltransferase [Clostridia bacterium]|nr:glycosyltransferase [Clostridia bacterium]